MTIRKRKTWVAIAAITLASAGIFPVALRADTITMTGLSPGQASVANRVAAPFSYVAGSPENAVALANALRTGTTATLSYTTTSADANSQTTTTTTDITVPTRPMGWGNVSHALALASYSLRQAGIEQPTAAPSRTQTARPQRWRACCNSARAEWAGDKSPSRTERRWVR